MSLDEFILLKAYKAGHKAGCSGDGWDNTARNQFWFVTIGGSDRIVFCSQIWRGHYKVHVEVRVVVLLEIRRQDLHVFECFGLRQLWYQIGQFVLICSKITIIFISSPLDTRFLV